MVATIRRVRETHHKQKADSVGALHAPYEAAWGGSVREAASDELSDIAANRCRVFNPVYCY